MLPNFEVINSYGHTVTRETPYLVYQAMTSNVNYPSLSLSALNEDWTTIASPRRRRGFGCISFLNYMLTDANKLTKPKPFPYLQTLSPSEGLRLDDAQALIQYGSQQMPGNRLSGALGNRAPEMLPALPLGFLTRGDFKDRAQSKLQKQHLAAQTRQIS